MKNNLQQKIQAILFLSAYAAAISRKNKRPESRAGQYAPPLLQQAKPGDFGAYFDGNRHSLSIALFD